MTSQGYDSVGKPKGMSVSETEECVGLDINLA